MTDGDGAVARPETAVLMLTEDEALTVRVRHEPGLDEALGMLASGANAEAV